MSLNQLQNVLRLVVNCGVVRIIDSDKRGEKRKKTIIHNQCRLRDTKGESIFILTAVHGTK